MLANIEQIRIRKLNRFIKSSVACFIVLEVSEIPLQQEIVREIQNSIKDILLIDFRNIYKTDYLQRIEESKSDIVIITNPLSAFGSIEDCCREINGNRDIYRAFNKIFIFMLEPCVVDYLISKCMSFWSCVELHENFTTISFNPFLYKSMLDYTINNREKSVQSFIKEEICNNFNCNKCNSFKPGFCYYYNSTKDGFDIIGWINSCVKVGDYLYDIADFKSALDYYYYANRLLSEKKSDFSTNYIRWRIANVFCKFGEYDKAISIFNELISLEKRDLLLAQLFNDLGITLLISFNGDVEQKNLAYDCLKNSKNILELYDCSDVKDYLKKVYYNLALFYYNEENLKCCIDYVNRLSELNDYSTQLDYEYYFVCSFLKIKYGNFFQKDFENNVKYFNNNSFFFEIYHNVLFYYIGAFYFFSINAIGTSIKYLRKVERILKEFENEKKLYCIYANTCHLKGVCYYYFNSFNDSSYYFERAIDYFNKANINVKAEKLKYLKDKL